GTVLTMPDFKRPIGAAFDAEFRSEPAGPAEERVIDNLRGTWQVVSFTTAGEKGSEEEARKYKITFSDGSFSVTKDGTVIQEGTYKVDPSGKPKAVDVAWTKGKGFESKSALGIYEVKEDELRICFGAPAAERPAEVSRPREFTSTAESKTHLSLYKRVG